MIVVSRLNGEQFGVNAEHIERIEEMPDTVLTLLDGKKYIVRESLQEVLDLVIEYRASILRISYGPVPDDDGGARDRHRDDIPLRLVGHPSSPEGDGSSPSAGSGTGPS